MLCCLSHPLHRTCSLVPRLSTFGNTSSGTLAGGNIYVFQMLPSLACMQNIVSFPGPPDRKYVSPCLHNFNVHASEHGSLGMRQSKLHTARDQNQKQRSPRNVVSNLQMFDIPAHCKNTLTTFFGCLSCIRKLSSWKFIEELSFCFWEALSSYATCN